ncbi:TPA: DotD/TraH family lipoprotein [Citrobacter freundii]|nr:DotD/TraH family lipoprotein [Citrobacter freundii]
MNYLILPGVLAISLLAGCQPWSPPSTPPASVSPDRYGAASSVAVARHTQYQMWNNGLWSGSKNAPSPMEIIRTNSAEVSFDWEGDAVELLAELARARGLQFNYSGVRLPLPDLHPRNVVALNRKALLAVFSNRPYEIREGRRVLSELTRHRLPLEERFGGWRPADYADALKRFPPVMRDEMRQKMNGVALILMPDSVTDREYLLENN